MFAYRFDIFFFILIIFIVDFANNLFKDIFQGDQTGCFTVFIQDNCDIERGLAHFNKKLGNALVFISEVGFTENVFNLELTFLTVIKKKIFHIDRSDNIIFCLLVNRKTGEFVFPEQVDQFVVTAVNISKSYVDTGNHDVFGNGITEIKHIVDHLFFI